MDHKSGTQTAAALRHRLNARSSFAPRAAAHVATSVPPGAADIAAQSGLTFVDIKEDQEVIVGHGQGPRWSAATPPPSALQAVGSLSPTKTAASPFSAGCARSRMRLQSKQSLGLSLGLSAKVLANPSVNRTLHGMPGFGPPFHSGPNPVIPFRAGYLKR